MSAIDALLGLLAPYECLSCHQEGDLLCRRCMLALPKPAASSHRLAGAGTVWTIVSYKGVAKALIWHLKASGTQAAAKIMAEQMAQRLTDLPSTALLAAVPTATSRVRARGYDQARLLSRYLARETGLKSVHCLARLGQTHQVGANRQQRLQQLKTAFRVTRPVLIRGQHLILVDDVTTTGASLELAAQVLLAAGAAQVDAITFAYAE